MKDRRNVLKYEVENKVIYVNVPKYIFLSKFMFMEASYNYVDVPIKLGHCVLKWSYCGSQRCWVKLWKLWAEGGIRIQLGYQQCHIEVSDDESEPHCVTSPKTRLPRHRTSLKWSLHL